MHHRRGAAGLKAVVRQDEAVGCGGGKGRAGSGSNIYPPERFAKVYLNWMENVRDWCISRQIWWGHRIPPPGTVHAGKRLWIMKTPPLPVPPVRRRNLTQDPDVLDTWFSSALWPFSTMGWPDDTEDLHRYFPTDVLVTGYDIIYFWVARMIIMSLAFMKEVPFHTVYIHGLVRDAQGRKMSKSLGNGIDPIEMIEQYGADTLRFTLITGQAPREVTSASVRRMWRRAVIL